MGKLIGLGIFSFNQCTLGTLIEAQAGVLNQTNPLKVPLCRAWGLHPIVIAMDVNPYTLTDTLFVTYVKSGLN